MLSDMDTRKNSQYFPHDCNAKDDPKIMLLMSQLGLEAYGIYWVLIEYLREQPGYRAPLILLDALSRRYGSSKEKFETVITKFDLFTTDGQYFTSPSLIRRMEPLDFKREKMKSLADKRWNKDAYALPAHMPAQCKSNAEKRREEKRRVKESKVEKSKEEIGCDDFLKISDDSNSNELLVKKFQQWIEFRKKIKKPYKTQEGASAAYNRLLTLSDSVSEVAIQIIEQSIANEWQGFFPLKEAKGPPGGIGDKRMTPRQKYIQDYIKDQT